MKSHARVVIIGGGSLGVNLLYHLTKEGWTDIALVEKGELTSGSTWHAAGLCGNFIGNMTVSQIHNYTIKLYNEILPAETGQTSSFHQTGSIRVGFSKVEEEWFRNLESRAKNVGFEFNLISKEEARKLNPLMNFDKARVIASTPHDGHVDPTSVVMPLSKLARDNGAEIYRFTRVTAINELSSGEWEVVTDKGTIVAEHVVNAAGCFAREIGEMVGATIPLTNLEHQYLVTESHPDIEALGWELPVCRDSYSSAYIRQEGLGFLVGPYEMWGSKPWALNGMDWDFDRELFEPDLDRLMPFLERCFELTPKFEEVGVKTVVNGPITHTPDDNILAGPQAGLRNFWNLCGASIGIAQGGIGKYMAQWMVYGQTELNMAPLDCRRFGDWADKKYCIIKAIESYEVMYSAAAPNDNRPHGRPMRTSPLYARLLEKGCVHGVVQGYEKALWFKTGQAQSESPTWAHSEAHDVVGEECRAVRDAAGIIDLSGSAKYEITGKDAFAFLDRLSCNKLPAKDGRIGLSLFHAPNGGIMCEMSITRLADDFYYLVSAIGSEHKDLHWMQSNADDFDVKIENVTDDLSSMLLTGPNSREILQQLTEDDLSNTALPWLHARDIKIDSAMVRVIRVSYAGELGYELHMPSYQLLSIYDSICRVGEDYGLRDFGGYAFNSMRLEKMYRAYGGEFTEEISGVEAGMERFIDTSRDFIGCESIKQRQTEAGSIQLAYLLFDDDIACECYGNEAVYHNGDLIGLTTSGAYGHRIGKSLAFAYLKPESISQGLEVTIDTSVGSRSAHIEMDAAYDASNQKLRS
ncbi:MAG: glycine cleavage system protein T [Gammaproteobacteria bacterium]|nr:MAG: glycine cleavage system protein T [Gammaproteobacteria bacterium]